MKLTALGFKLTSRMPIFVIISMMKFSLFHFEPRYRKKVMTMPRRLIATPNSLKFDIICLFLLYNILNTAPPFDAIEKDVLIYILFVMKNQVD